MKKRDYTFHLYPELSNQIDSHMSIAEKASRSEFVSSAVEFYCTALDTNTKQVFLGDEIIRTMKAIVDDMEGRIFSHFRSQDISLSMLSVLFAASLVDMTSDEIDDIRKTAVRYVNENRSAKSFVTALKDERGDK